MLKQVLYIFIGGIALALSGAWLIKVLWRGMTGC